MARAIGATKKLGVDACAMFVFVFAAEDRDEPAGQPGGVKLSQALSMVPMASLKNCL